MNQLDLVLVTIMGYCLVRGLFRGLIKELSSIIGVAGGVYAAYSYYPLLSRQLALWITNPGYQKGISFLFIFTVICVVVGIVGGVIKYLMNIVFLGWADRLLGVLFGALKGVLIISVVVLALTTFLPRKPAIVEKSWVAQDTMRISAFLIQVTPPEMKERFAVKLKELSAVWRSQ